MGHVLARASSPGAAVQKVASTAEDSAQASELVCKLRSKAEAPRCRAGWAKKPSICPSLGRIFNAKPDKLVEQLEESSCHGTYFVQFAGVPEVNGIYAVVDNESRNGSPCFRNEAGVMLLRYGAPFWYFVKADANLDFLDGDYYRIRSGSATPPCTGWTCGLEGRMPLPLLIHTPAGDLEESVGGSSGSGLKAVPAGRRRITADTSHETVQLEILLLSGERLKELKASLQWTVAQVKAALRPFLQGRDSFVAQLVHGQDVLENDYCLGRYISHGQASLNAIIQRFDMYLDGAGTAVANGPYMIEDRRNGAPVYVNANGLMLFRYRFISGSLAWYVSEPGNLDSSAGDYYRVKTADLRPPTEGWSINSCPKGILPAPTLEFGRTEEEIAVEEEAEDEDADEHDIAEEDAGQWEEAEADGQQEEEEVQVKEV